MAVKIRLARRGRKKLAIYDVVVADERAPRDGRFIEKIGTYNPNHNPASININNERALKWLLNGAQPTDTVKAMLSYRGVMLKKHLQIGVLKGAISQEQADEKFQGWIESKEANIADKVDKIGQERSDARKKALDAEAAKNQARLDVIKAREDEAKAAAAAEVAAAEAAAAPAVEETPEAQAEEAPEAKTEVEAPAAKTSSEEKPAESKEAPKAESKEETAESTPEAKDAPKAESKEEAPESTPEAKEAPKAESKEEAPEASADDEEKKD